MADYVKFRRGLLADFEKLAKKDADTLYFITATNGATMLYMGDSLISAGDINDVVGATTIAGLEDVDVTTLADGSILVYDADAQKWVATSLDEVAPKANVTIIDGDGRDHVVQITEKAPVPATGDIAIVKDIIYGTKVQHTAYVYNGSNWAAMDGNYSAENVYFEDDLITTTAIGNVSLSGGQATINVKGKNLIDLFNTLYVKEDKKDLLVDEPTANVSGSVTYYEVGSTGSKDVTLTLNSDGKYKYGYSKTPAEPSEGDSVSEVVNDESTGVVVNTAEGVTTYSLTFDGKTITPKTTGGNVFTLAPAARKDTATLSASGIVKHTQGAVPVSNLKVAYPTQRIAAGSKSDSTEEFRWYIPFYQGFTTDANVIADHANITATQLTTGLLAPTDGTIKSKTKIIESSAYSKTKITTATSGNAWRQYYLAYPKSWGYDMSAAKDGNGIDCTVLQATDVDITYGTGDNAVTITYAVYYINNAAAYDTKKISWTLS